MGRSPSSDENGLKKGPWTPEEDEKLVEGIKNHGHGSWRALPKLAGLNRCGKSCRLRWTNYLKPDIKRGNFSQEEEQTILHLHSILGNKWSTIATHLPGRTDNEIKNFWNTHLKKKLIHMGFDPMTHQPRTDLFSSLPNLVALASLRDLMEQPSLEEQALKLQYLQYLQYLFQPAAAATPEIDCVYLWNSMPSLEENPVFNSPQIMQNQSLFPIASPIMSNSQPLQNPIISPAHVVGPPQVPFNFQMPLSSDVVGQDFDFDNPPNFQSILPSTCSSSGHLLLMNENSTSNPGYGSSSSSSSHGAGATSSYWPELLFEEPFMDETS
ncbi:hypothetical protein RHMOL_Rhmol06G0102000 [Rhododendron molle]|uniref:Uncharacterized protein n=1 Tax=Rhododendron molle TaxID=49168 RepID=A0ACC0NAN3_RHOML|nr:hypothetical protein RHMOL_Rhmol06G0102000 [Rhododendron molle]